MVLTIDAQSLDVIKAQAEQAYPHECCGLLIGQSQFENGLRHKTVQTLQPTENAWSDLQDGDVAYEPEMTATRRYWIAPADLVRIQKYARTIGCDIIGVYHSHPDHPAIPSECDRKQAWPQYSYIIVSVQQGIADDLQSWMLDDQAAFQPEAVVIGSDAL